MASQSHDHFPSTHRTWIADHLTVICEEPHSPAADVAHRTLSAYIMNRYNEPLRAYVSAAALRDLGEPQELVASFFARSFDNSILLQRWISSGIALRRWLMNAISLHCRGLRRDLRRNQSRVRTESELGATGSIDAISSQASHSAERAFDRAWALAITNEAHEIARMACIERERAGDYEAFRLHIVDGAEHVDIAQRLNITRTQSVNAVRRVASMMRDEVRELLRAEGVAMEDLDQAVAELIQLSSDVSP